MSDSARALGALPGIDEISASPLERLQQLVDAGCSHIKEQCLGADGRLDPELLDQWQQASYELAFCAAELAACRSLLGPARQPRQDNELSTALTRLFCAETSQSVWQRLLLRQRELGLDREQLLKLYGSDPAQSLSACLDAEFQATVGADIVAGQVKSLPSTLEEDKELVRSTFRRFADEVVAPLAEAIHREDQDIPDELIRQAAELGCFGTCIPERFGGLQPDDKPDSLGMIVVTEELSRASLGAAGSLITRPEIAARALLAGGSDAQQQHWLPKLASGEMLCAISITEPNTGSDVAAVALKARPVEGGWLLNGSKTWCTFAGRSRLIVVLARTEPDPALGYKGLSMFLVEKPDYPGHAFEYRQEGGGSLSGKAIATIGYRGMHSYDLFFEDFFVPDQCLVGEAAGQGKGFYYTMAGFAGGRIQTAARATGVMQAAFEKALDYACERQAFGMAVADYQLTRVKLARMLATITASRRFSYQVAELMDQGGGQMEASLVKLFSCRAAEWITREAMQIHGGMGYAEESAVSRYFVDARVLSIFEGAEEVLAIKVIARQLIENA